MATLLQPDELARLKALRCYRHVISAVCDRVDRLTYRIARTFHVPIAFITLIDAYQQWFVSCHGVRLAPIDRDLSLCDAAFRAGETLVVENARLDARFGTNPLVRGEPNIRFYASTPLRTPSGLAIGTLCLADGVSRQFDPAEAQQLEAVAAQVAGFLEQQRASAEGDSSRPFLLGKLDWAF